MGTNYYVKNSLNPETDCLHIGKSSGDQDSWMGILVRRGEELGVIVRSEITWHTSYLFVKMDSGERLTIQLNNIGEDPNSAKDFEWYCITPQYKAWMRF